MQLRARPWWYGENIAVHVQFLVINDPDDGAYFNQGYYRMHAWELHSYRYSPESESLYSLFLRQIDNQKIQKFSEIPVSEGELLDNHLAAYGRERWGYVTRSFWTFRIADGSPVEPPWFDYKHVQYEWRGDDANRVLATLKKSKKYNGTESYLTWPGPNSNTYAAWVMKEAGVGVDLHPLMVGRNHLHGISGWSVGLFGFGFGLSPSRTGIQAETPLFGIQVGVKEGVEVHPFGLTLGIDFWPLAVKTPLGRFGFQE